VILLEFLDILGDLAESEVVRLLLVVVKHDTDIAPERKKKQKWEHELSKKARRNEKHTGDATKRDEREKEKRREKRRSRKTEKKRHYKCIRNLISDDPLIQRITRASRPVQICANADH